MIWLKVYLRVGGLGVFYLGFIVGLVILLCVSGLYKCFLIGFAGVMWLLGWWVIYG